VREKRQNYGGRGDKWGDSAKRKDVGSFRLAGYMDDIEIGPTPICSDTGPDFTDDGI
jgi:hypothetical protein